MSALTVAITMFNAAPHLERAIHLGGYAQFGLSFLDGGAYRRVHMWYKPVA